MLVDRLFAETARDAVEKACGTASAVTLDRKDLTLLVEGLLKSGFELGVKASVEELRERQGHVVKEGV